MSLIDVADRLLMDNKRPTVRHQCGVDRCMHSDYEIVPASEYDKLRVALERIVAIFNDEGRSGDPSDMVDILSIAMEALK